MGKMTKASSFIFIFLRENQQWMKKRASSQLTKGFIMARNLNRKC
jgi:hypothetical protein